MTQKKPIYDFFFAHVCKFLFIFKARGVFMKRILYACLPIFAVFLFWACGEGSLEWTENNDILALERIENVTEADFLKALENCKENPDCRANTDSELLNALDSCEDDDECRAEFFKKYIKKVADPDTVDTAEVVSSSSEIDLFSSSSCDSCDVSSSSEDLSSSSGLDSLESSSSAILESSSAVLSSSSTAQSSSSPILSSSVIIKSSSSLKMSSSFVFPSSSSKKESSSSVEDPCTKEKLGAGVCKVVGATEVSYDGEAKWRYVPVQDCGVGLIAEWELLEADVPGKNGLEVIFKFSDHDLVGEKVSPSLTVKKGNVSTSVDCSNATVKIKDAPVQQSSSSVIPPSSSSVKSSSSIYVPPPEECSVPPMSQKWMCNLEGRKNEECVQNDGQWVCPTGQQVSSSSVVPSSSSVIPPSSSSVEPPPPSSSSNVTVLENFSPNESASLAAGSYELQKCNGKTGSQTIQIRTNFGDCFNIFEGAQVNQYWNNSSTQCEGQGNISFPITFTVPEGGTLTIRNGCW